MSLQESHTDGMTEELSGAPNAPIERGELLRLSGISPVDLSNWIARGLLPSPTRRYFKGLTGCRSYYPAWACERAKHIRLLRGLGLSGRKVRKVLRGEKVEL